MVLLEYSSLCIKSNSQKHRNKSNFITCWNCPNRVSLILLKTDRLLFLCQVASWFSWNQDPLSSEPTPSLLQMVESSTSAPSSSLSKAKLSSNSMEVLTLSPSFPMEWSSWQWGMEPFPCMVSSGWLTKEAGMALFLANMWARKTD